MFTIENEHLKVTVQAKGAELTRLYHKKNELDYLWDANPEVWGKHSPVLFPIVGTLKNNSYQYKGNTYQLGRHGFARDKIFAVDAQTADTITLVLYSDEETLKVYPFNFEFRIRYSLYEESLSTAYEVKNTGDDVMYFSVGAHPAFKVPLEDDAQYTDYYLVFDKLETAPRWPISPDGLIEKEPQPLLEDSNKLMLKKELFHRDALVLKQIDSSVITFKSDTERHGFRFDFPGFPFLGLWAAKNADFLCIEPWCGIADSVTSNQQLPDKEGINKLQPQEQFTRTWTVSLF